MVKKALSGLALGIMVVNLPLAFEPDWAVQIGAGWARSAEGARIERQEATVHLETGSKVYGWLDLPFVGWSLPAGSTGSAWGPIGFRRQRQGISESEVGLRGAPLGTESSSRPERGTIARTGLGDVRVGAGVTLSGGGVRLHRLDLTIEGKAPTANSEDGLGTGVWDFRIALAGERQFWASRLWVEGGWNHLGDPVGVELKDVPDLAVGWEKELPGGSSMAGIWAWTSPETLAGEGRRNQVGLRFRRTVGAAWSISVGFGLGAPAESFTVLWTWHPAARSRPAWRERR